MKHQSSTTLLPITGNVTRAYTTSYVIALLLAGLSLAGLVYQNSLYPTEELRRSFISNDVVNLFIGLPILLGSMWYAKHNKLIGLLFWPGALFYTLYNYIAYAVALPRSLQFVIYCGLVVLSVYALWALLSKVDSQAIRQRLGGVVPERLSGGVLVGLGTLFLLRGIGQALGALTGQTTLTGPELAVVVADLLTIPAWIIGGALLWRRQAFGYVMAAGLLFQASMLFSGLLVFFILQPLLAATPFAVADFVVIFSMGLICFIPFGLFARGIVAAGGMK